MSTISTNKTIVRRWYEEVWNQGKLKVLDEILARPDSVKQYIDTFRAAFPDVQHTICEMVEEGDSVVTRWTAKGTHSGQWHGIAPTNNAFSYDGVTFVQLDAGKIVHHQTIWDALILLEQLEQVPAIRKGDGSRL